ncbi:HIT family protein [Ovoidimarina sediminis]|uniref:HIT family protein n=1 Tax=Ovoidimarina sediminis TaxID=3079856 RepID=UPI002906DD6F|nr:HIT family protein [Rhodophyticola sp. MJ-SS7]MDU8944400.1 HIT family protein [Rhodophyticola sp. MJ-SS7]
MHAASCLFCDFATGAAPCHEVYRSDGVLAFLDNAPIRPGHVQIVPLRHVETFDLLEDTESAEIMGLAKRLACLQKRLFRTDRVAFLFTGGDIAHAHAHLFPMQQKDDITSRRYIRNTDLTFRSLPAEADAALADMAARLSAAL